MLKFLVSFVLVVLVLAQEPNPPTWPENVYVFDPSTPDTTQKIVDEIFHLNGGNNPAFHGQWSPLRVAFLFETGTHDVTVNVGYYTSVIGLGQAPTDTRIGTVTCQNGDFDFTGGALANFWRSAENFQTTPTTYWNNSPAPAMLWAVSQASPLRRINVQGDLALYQYNSGCCAGYASGGYLGDSLISGIIQPGSQQQWFTRNTQMGGWNGGVWNMVFMGNSVGLPTPHCGNSGGLPITTVTNTPIIAEKPYMTLINGRYSLVIPNVETNKYGPTTNFNNAKIVDFSQVFVARDTDSASTINSKLNSGLHLVLSPGNYNLTDSIVVANPNTVVLGIGFPTLISTTGKPAVVVTGSEGVRVAGILLQAGPYNTTSLLTWGNNDAGNPSNPGFLYDCFARVGGTNNPAVQQVTADTMVQISQGYVVMDNSWLWRADHGVDGLVYNEDNPCENGLIVDADNVLAYGLAVEHQIKDLVQWNGNNGQTIFYQSELPYDVTPDYGTNGYTGFRVGNSVSAFKGYGMGVYSYFRDYSVYVNSGIVAPVTANVDFINSLTVFLNGNGGINHIVNDEGAAVSAGNTLAYLCNN